MKRLSVLAAVLCAAPSLLAQSVSGQAMLGYQLYDYDSQVTSGFRQTYQVRLDRPLSDAGRFFLTLRGEDLSGHEDNGRARLSSNTRILHPTANLSIDLGDLHLFAKSDYIDSRSDLGGARTGRTNQRTNGEITWRPTGLPTFSVIGQRSSTRDDSSVTRLTDEYLSALTTYSVRGLQVNGSEQFTRSISPVLGYTRSARTHAGDIQYSRAYLSGRMIIAAQAGTRLTHIDQRATDDRPVSVPNPVAVVHAYWGVDDTPADSRDHPPSLSPSLIDGDLTRGTGLSLGPDGISFQNLTLELGRLERVDEIRIVVRDRSGDPLRRGGGPVSWDAYSSTDGVVWTLIPSASGSFNSPLSYYSVTFDSTTTRWIKVVSFGVNSEETFITEVQGFYHTTITPGGSRSTDQAFYSSTLTSTIQPTRRLTLSYSGAYNSLRQTEPGRNDLSSRDFSHIGGVQFTLARPWTLRGQYMRTQSEAMGGSENGLDGYASFVDYEPTRKLRLTLEYRNEDQRIESNRFTIDTRALHVIASVLPSVSTTVDVGVQDQSFEDGSEAHRQFALLALNAELTRTLRTRLSASLQRSDSPVNDLGVFLLGPERDDRGTFDLIWRPGEKLTLTGRVGYAQGLGYSGVTHKYHVEWVPFGDGTVSVAAAFDQDFDPTFGRRASRVFFNPRWAMNRHASLDLNYTVTTSSSEVEQREQRTAFATVTITK